MKIIISVLLVCILSGIYAYRYMCKHINIRTARYIYSLFIISAIIYSFISNIGESFLLFWIFKSLAICIIFFSAITIPMAFIALIEDIYRYTRKYISHTALPPRHRAIWITSCIFSLTSILFLSYSLIHTKTDWKIYPVDIYSSRIPASMDSLRIVQISDLHLGSFDISSRDSLRISRAMEMINDLSPHIIVFTGDIVNGNSSEMKPWVDILGKTHAPYGKYAVMGNHDYATYEKDFTPQDRETSIENIKKYYFLSGYQILDNSHSPIIIGHDTIYVAGVENWGRGPFPALGDIDKALDGISQDKFTILLSHDPSHFEEIVSSHPQMVDLTLSGHTHAMQCGIEINDRWRWSPVKYVYKYWAGFYEENKRMLYVNRGLGFHFFPARVGIRPEITFITLHKEYKN